jgi:dolichyl-phosphate-mannose-protein mannosyltransferase
LAINIDTSGIPPLQRNVVQNIKDFGWILAGRFVLDNRGQQNLFLYPKLVMTGLAAVLGAFVFLWARELFGVTAGVIALVLYCFDPNILAHSSIIHTDIPFALCFFAGSYFYWRAAQRLTWGNLFGASLLFALSAVVKFSFLVIVPIWILLGILQAYSAQPHQSQITSPEMTYKPGQKMALHSVILGTALIAAYLSIWAAYGFRFDAFGGAVDQLRIGRLVTKESWLSVLAILNAKYFILPEAWLYGLLDAIRASTRESYLLGQIHLHGTWLYFPVAFAVKTPLPTLMVLLLAIILSVRRRSLMPTDLFLLIPVIIFFAVAIGSKLNIGLRHILPIYPFLFVWIGGQIATIWASRSRTAQWGVSLLGIWLLISTLRVAPDYLAFFNELAGGPGNGHRILVDSNLDWGQDLKGLHNWMSAHDVSRIQLAYFGTLDAAYYGIDADPLPGTFTILSRPRTGDHAAPSHIAISVTYLKGLYLWNRDPYASFRQQKPVAIIGHSIWVFRSSP